MGLTTVDWLHEVSLRAYHAVRDLGEGQNTQKRQQQAIKRGRHHRGESYCVTRLKIIYLAS